jgi:hypothetical protein
MIVTSLTRDRDSESDRRRGRTDGGHPGRHDLATGKLARVTVTVIISGRGPVQPRRPGRGSRGLGPGLGPGRVPVTVTVPDSDSKGGRAAAALAT